MAHTLSHDDQSFDFKNIFIGREHQLAEFERLLPLWQHLMASQQPEDELLTDIPSPHNKIPGLVVMLYGRGGFGKSTLLWRYHGMATRINHSALSGTLTICKPLDWETVLDDRLRALFNPQSGQSLDPIAYYTMLCDVLAHILHKQSKDFRLYQQIVHDVEKARTEASKVLEELQREKDDRFKGLGGASIEVVSTLISTAFPAIPVIKTLASNEKVKQAADAALTLSAEQIAHIRERLRRRIGEQFAERLNPARSLGLALGNDVRTFAQNYPVLIFFDTYEEIDEADALLQIVMGASGRRVGWVIAGRDNLWSGAGQRKRSLTFERGYKEITHFDRSLSVNFNSEDVGAFTPDNIREYFDQLCRLYPCSPPLPPLTDDDIAHLWDLTQGISLAINLAAALYSEKHEMQMVTSPVEGQREIIDQMVHRYLLHTRIAPEERTKLYAIALLRRPDQQTILAAALGLTPEEASQPNRFDEELSRLHRRYSFIFTEKVEPTLHEEVRTYLRRWLLERRTQPDILALNTQLTAPHENALQHLETQRAYTCLKDRLQDTEWTAAYLDLTEQRFWLDPVQGLTSLLPFMVAASIYQRDLNEAAAAIGNFFGPQLHSPYKNWWHWLEESLVSIHSHHPSLEERTGLEEIHRLLQQQRLPLSLYINQQKELQAALWWRLGESHESTDDRKALTCYETALSSLPQEQDLKVAIAETCCRLGGKSWTEKKYTECLNFANKALTLQPDYAWAYYARGAAFAGLQEYARAIDDYTETLRLSPEDADAYYNRGLAFYNNSQWQQAIDDLSVALTRNPDSTAYLERGYSYLHLKQKEQALADFIAGIEKDPRDVNIAWMALWTSFDKQRPNREGAEHLEKIASIDPQQYEETSYCKVVASALRGNIKEGLTLLEQVLQHHPDTADTHFWYGMLSASYHPYRPQPAITAIEKALEYGMPPILLTPLYWLEKDRPDFFQHYARPLLDRYGM